MGEDFLFLLKEEGKGKRWKEEERGRRKEREQMGAGGYTGFFFVKDSVYMDIWLRNSQYSFY